MKKLQKILQLAGGPKQNYQVTEAGYIKGVLKRSSLELLEFGDIYESLILKRIVRVEAADAEILTFCP